MTTADARALPYRYAARVSGIVAASRDYVTAVNCISVSVLRSTYSRVYPALSLGFAPIHGVEYSAELKERNI